MTRDTRERSEQHIPSCDSMPRGRVTGAVAAATLSHRSAPALRIEGLVDTDVPGGVADHAVAVLGEALSNVARHSGAGTVDVPGSGLKNMAERAAVLGGTLTPGEREESGGTLLGWRVPVSPDGAPETGRP
jgi:signal transduction histidine kinase